MHARCSLCGGADQKAAPKLGQGLFCCRVGQGGGATYLAALGGNMADAGRVGFYEPAGFLGMSAEILLTVYGHHHQDFQERAANAGRGRRTSKR